MSRTSPSDADWSHADRLQAARSHAEGLDARSPLAARRELFDLPDDVVYLCGNSLGALPRSVPGRVADVVRREWGVGLVGSWNTAGWSGLSRRVATRIAPLLGVDAADVVVGDSTSVSLFKVLVAAARLRPERSVIVVEPTTFPTDGYVAAGVARTLGLELRWCDPADPAAALGPDVAVLLLTHVDFRSGAMFDMAEVTSAAHDAGAVMVWDLCHSAGAVPVDLTAADADLAVGCTYKYLNGGPGSPAFTWVAPRHQGRLDQPVTGWWGHARPFAMEDYYAPAPGIGRFLCGTQPVVSMALAECGLDIALRADLDLIRAKSVALAELFLDLVAERCPEHPLTLITPRDSGRRGSQLSFAHPAGFAVMQALIERGVIGDYREPEILRFGLTPLYLRYVDIWDAVEILRDILDRRAWDDERFHARSAVT